MFSLDCCQITLPCHYAHKCIRLDIFHSFSQHFIKVHSIHCILSDLISVRPIKFILDLVLIFFELKLNRDLEKGLYGKWNAIIKHVSNQWPLILAHIHTPTAVSAMQGDIQLVWGS